MEPESTDVEPGAEKAGAVKVDIVTGFLGAGKTTFINKLLDEGLSTERVALVENEFGDVSIDDELLESDGIEVETLAAGCICCTLRGDLYQALQRIVTDYRPQRIIIEPTGLATPMSIADICTKDLWRLDLRIDAIVTVADARDVDDFLDMEIPIFEDQLKTARLVALSHTQELGEDEVGAVVQTIRGFAGNPELPVIDRPWAEVDALEILGLAEVEMENHPVEGSAGDAPDGHGEHGHEHEHHHDHDHEHDHGHGEHGHHHEVGGCVSFSFAPGLVAGGDTAARLTEALGSAPHGTVLRAKGFLKADGGGMALYQYVPGSGTLEPSPYGGEPKFAVIGRGIEEADFAELLG